MPVIAVSQLKQHILDTVTAIRDAVTTLNAQGIAAELPEFVDFEVTCLTPKGAGAIKRTSTTAETVDIAEETAEETVQTQEQTERRDNDGGSKDTTSYEYESDE